MTSNLVSDRPPLISLLRILGIITFGYVVLGNVIAVLVISLLYDGNLADALTNPQSHPELRMTMLAAQGAASTVGLGLVPMWYLWSSEGRNVNRFFISIPSWHFLLPILVLLTVAFAFAISPVTDWNASIELPPWTGGLGRALTDIEKQAAILIKAFTENLTPGAFAVGLLVIGVLPALTEELVFRGLLQTELVRALGNAHAAIWITATFFSAFHLQYLGFFPRLLTGLFLGYLYLWTGNLWMPIIAHFLNNGLQLLAIYLHQNGIISWDVEGTQSTPLWIVAASMGVTGVLLYYFQRNFVRTPATG